MSRLKQSKANAYIFNILKILKNRAYACHGNFTPYNLMESLKEKSPQSDELTHIGELLKHSINEKTHFDSLRWIVFHFDFPIKLFGFKELETRNWISLRTIDQELVNYVHQETISKGTEFIKDIYAPSVVASMIKMSCPLLAEKFRDKWWIYRLGENNGECLHLSNEYCCSKQFPYSDIVCFSRKKFPEGQEYVSLKSCRNDLIIGDEYLSTLGRLLNEPESKALDGYKKYEELVYSRSYKNKKIGCNFYARIPIFFQGITRRYMTEIFVALSTDPLKTPHVVDTLNAIAPSLELCVSLINSEIAYSIGELVRTREMAELLHAVLRHDLKNLGEALDAKISILFDSWEENSKDTNRISKALLEIKANTFLSLMSAELDFLWRQKPIDKTDLIPLRNLKLDLDKVWQFENMAGCEFTGDWESTILVPRACRIVFSNLIRNALASPKNIRIRLDCRISDDFLTFGCLSISPFPMEEQKLYIENPLPSEIPSRKKGIWLSRYVVEKLLSGILYVAGPIDEYQTHIRFELPKKIISQEVINE